jgi:hypothetical protein
MIAWAKCRRSGLSRVRTEVVGQLQWPNVVKSSESLQGGKQGSVFHHGGEWDEMNKKYQNLSPAGLGSGPKAIQVEICLLGRTMFVLSGTV